MSIGRDDKRAENSDGGKTRRDPPSTPEPAVSSTAGDPPAGPVPTAGSGAEVFGTALVRLRMERDASKALPELHDALEALRSDLGSPCQGPQSAARVIGTALARVDLLLIEIEILCGRF